MKQITITVPDNCELKQDGNTYTIVEKEKLTYEDVAKKLFSNSKVYFTSAHGEIVTSSYMAFIGINDANNAKSKRQLEKLLAINKLMNVAKYLNGDWKPDWGNTKENKYFICYSNRQNNFYIDMTYSNQSNDVFFKSIELVNQAIKILGEETIKLALCTDY